MPLITRPLLSMQFITQTSHQNKNARSLYIDFTLMLSASELGLPARVHYQVFIHSFIRKQKYPRCGRELRVESLHNLSRESVPKT